MQHNPFAHVSGLDRVDLGSLRASLHNTPMDERVAYMQRVPYLPLPDLLLLLAEGPAPALVRQLFPQPFPAYSRIFSRVQVDGRGAGGERYWRWDYLTARVGRQLTGSVSLRPLLGQMHHELLAQDIRVEPHIGQLDHVTAQAFADVLQQVAPASVQSYFFVRGHAGLGPDWGYVYQGSANLIEHFHLGHSPLLETPTMWWAKDGSWCLTTPQDSPASYLGGTEAIVHAMLQDNHIEGYSVVGTDRVDDWLAN